MSSTNHIIIPIVDCRQNLEDQKVFVPTYSLLTPSKRTEFPELAFWKKSSSAFKKFKQKKDRKEKRKETSNQNSDLFLEVKQRRCLKLVPREKMPLQAMRQNTNTKDLHYEYFDPNEAPLLQTVSSCKDEMLSKSTEQKSTPEKDQEIIQYINQQKMDLENKEELAGLKMEIQPRQDDPFIIIRKDNGKKSKVRNCGETKGGKTKIIKKERAFKGKESDEQEREKYILNRISKVMDSDEMRNQDMPIPALIKSKTSQSASRKEINESQSISSSQENQRPYLQQCPTPQKLPFLQLLSFSHPLLHPHPQPQPEPSPSVQCHCILIDNKETQCKFVQ